MDHYEKQKEATAGWATIVWIASGLFLYLTTEGASLFSWSAFAFFLIGMFAAGIVFGIAFYLLQRGIAKVLLSFIQEPTYSAAVAISSVGIALLVLQTVLVYWTARWVFHNLAL